jgi:O-antigen/teichoic acid export membrane protein
MLTKLKSFYATNSANRAAINTIIIYIQRFFAAGLSLITTPLLLKALGIEDFGLYALTIGFVGMLAVLNWSLSNATQRYTAFAIGEGDYEKLKKVFSTALVIHFLYGLLLFLIILGISFFFVEDFLNIPAGKVVLAKNVLNVVAFMSFLSIMTIPFLGILKSQENFFSIAVIGIIESVSKLVIAILLLQLVDDRLIVYALLLLVVSIISFLIYVYVVKRNYKMVSISAKYYDKLQAKEMSSFLSWSLVGSLALTSRNEGVQVLLNIFFGVVVNAAYGIAMQVNAAMAILSQGVLGSLSPQIIKSAGQKDYDKMIFLMRTMSKFAIFSISLFAIPLFFECGTILHLWLGTVPANTIIFVRLFIIFGQIMLLSAGIQNVFDALGKVKEYNIWVSLILLLNLPLAYVLFKFNFPPYTIIFVGMTLELVSLQVRLYLLKKHVDFSILHFYLDTIRRVIVPSLCVGVILYSIRLLELNVYAQLVVTFLVAVLVYPVLIYMLSLEAKQKEIVVGLLSKIKWLKIKK